MSQEPWMHKPNANRTPWGIAGLLAVALLGGIIPLLMRLQPYLVAKYRGREADLRAAMLVHAPLAGADLRRVNLRRANLRGANLTKANLCGANFTCADLQGAVLAGANLGYFCYPSPGPDSLL